MDFYMQIILSLLFIIITHFIICFYLIKTYNKMKGINIGPKIGELLYENDFKIIRKFEGEHKFENSILVFISIGCRTCIEILEQVNREKDRYKEIKFISVYREEEQFKYTKEMEESVLLYRIEEKDIITKYGVTQFPYYIKLNENKVIDKGFINQGVLTYLVKEVIDE